MTLQEIKDQVAQEYEYRDWWHLLACASYDEMMNVVDEVAHRFAKAYAEADRKDCAEKATTIQEGFWAGEIDKSSILDRPYPEML